jgi:PAS domain S-box-containing protein
MAEANEIPARALLEAQGLILDMMSNGAELRDTLTAIARLVESLAPPALCSVVLLKPDGKHLKPIAAPSLPEAYCAAIDGVEIGPCAGSCGTASWRKEPVIVTDIATDPLWAGPREFTLSFGLRACWSLPILHHDGSVLGTIAMYYREPRGPTNKDWGLLAPCAKLVRLALAVSRKQNSLLANEARLHLAIEASGLGTFDYDFTTRASQWSPRLAEILGYPKGYALTPIHFARLLNPRERRDLFSNYRRLSDPCDTVVQHQQVTIRRADTGEERIVVVRGRVVFGADGAPQRTIGTVADITEQVHRERDLAEAMAEAEAANHAKSKFLANMSHELRTPLNAIIGFSDLMMQGVLGKVSPEPYVGYVGDIHKSGKHLLSLINDVLDMAKIEADRFELQRTPLDVTELAQGALIFVSHQAKEKNVSLKADVPRGVTLTADERALRQVLTNLLSNAVKFTLAGGTVRLFANVLPGGALALGVEDTGIGMDEEGVEIALRPFGQVQSDISLTADGTGLGLPLAKALVEQHGATFHITSEVAVGTRVWAEFPAADVSRRSDAAARG